MRIARDETKLVLVGERIDQLSPVQGGAVFNGLIKAPTAVFCSCGQSRMHLATNHRRSISPSSSVLGELCDVVEDGKAEEALALAKWSRRYSFH